MDRDTLSATLANARENLIARWDAREAWCGRLSASALSTATASMAFGLSARAGEERGQRLREHERLAGAGRAWLRQHQNEDGGWGDTTASKSNISTTTLCWSALGLGNESSAAIPRAEEWLARKCGDLEPKTLARAIRDAYGRDHTFSVPILMTCALGGRLGKGSLGWRFVRSLPFELAACPHQWFPRLRLRMVSYALPALIAIGQARHHHRPTWNPLGRLARHLARKRTLRTRAEIQPESGGYLEAAPLTSFVSMALLSMGQGDHPVVRRGLGFLENSVREDGSWPIDTHLATWLTTLAVNALRGSFNDAQRRSLTRAWLLDQQHEKEHTYTHAAPGGWAWTPLSGGVPDADDTAGALLALRHLKDGDAARDEASLQAAAAQGVAWLLDLMNRDGGIPTFCRGWGKLPFDRSSPDLTAHALRAFAAWREDLPDSLQDRADRARALGVGYLLGAQRDDGAWVPLWFGNQEAPLQENPLYGTSRVLRAVAAVRCDRELDREWIASGARALEWLLSVQEPSGGFGAAKSVSASVEETALATEALAEWKLSGLPLGEAAGEGRLRSALERGAAWLAKRTEGGTRFDAAPIGLYFARLWYHEELYPLIFAVSALALAERALRATPASLPKDCSTRA